MNKNFDQQIAESNIIIVIHESVSGGPGHILAEFLNEKHVGSLFFIAHPLLYMRGAERKSSRYEYYEDGKIERKEKASHWIFPEPILYIKDFLYTFFWVMQTRKKYELFVGLDPLNALSGIVLRILGRVERVVYYSIDYFPTRFENQIMNWFYHQVDKFAVRFADETWNVGKRMKKARAAFNNMKEVIYEKKQYHVPIGIWFAKINRRPIDTFRRNKLVFAGHFVSFMGVDLVIRALPKIKKTIPDVRLEIIGRGEEEAKWKKLADVLHVKQHILYKDWIQERGKFYSTLASAAVGLASFNLHILDDKVKNADPGKIKDYTSSGLPVITTKALFTWRDIERAQCGIVINYNADELADAVLRLLKDKSLLLQYRKNAVEYAKQFDWEELFSTNLSRVLSR